MYDIECINIYESDIVILVWGVPACSLCSWVSAQAFHDQSDAFSFRLRKNGLYLKTYGTLKWFRSPSQWSNYSRWLEC